MTAAIRCNQCGLNYPESGTPYRCQACGGIYDFVQAPRYNPARIDRQQPGIWKYAHSFGLPGVDAVSLGEGNTPFLWANVSQQKVAFKCEFLNPTGSFKDRGSAILMGWLKSKGIESVVEDSSGNAGASLAAYGARAGIKTTIFIPETASGPKRRQIAEYGAELVPIRGSRADVAKAVVKEAEAGATYASHAYLPFSLAGHATAAYEIYDQLGGKMPGTVITPAGQGMLTLGLYLGFANIRIASHGNVRIPKFICVQTLACAPLYHALPQNMSDVTGCSRSIAEGVCVPAPLRKKEILDVINRTRGAIFGVEEDRILAGRDKLAQLGFYVEPTSAIVCPVLEDHPDEFPEPVVVLLTGSGYKYE